MIKSKGLPAVRLLGGLLVFLYFNWDGMIMGCIAKLSKGNIIFKFQISYIGIYLEQFYWYNKENMIEVMLCLLDI